MFEWRLLEIPIVVAPMTGGWSTPALAAAASNAGALGFLGGGAKTVAALAAEVTATQSITDRPFGVNLFVPDAANSSPEHVPVDAEARRRSVARYREQLGEEADRYGVILPDTDSAATDDWDDKVSMLIERRVALVTFTFGLPARSVLARFHAAGTSTAVTVTDLGEASAANAHGARAIVVQGPHGGGHRGTHSVGKTPNSTGLAALVTQTLGLGIPIIAAGGLTDPGEIAAILGAGAVAVQLGTAFLRSPEAGTSSVHREALVSGRFTTTTSTRAFSGRFARGLTNRFILEHQDQAPAAFPEVNQLTATIRAAARQMEDPEALSLWCGIGFQRASDLPAAVILADIWQDTKPLLRHD